jgi:serine/threonine protein kinase
MRPLCKRSNAALTGLVKICDFGLSRMLSFSSSAAGTFLGTACYMSPERLNGQVGRPYSRPFLCLAIAEARHFGALRCAACERQGLQGVRSVGLSSLASERLPCGTASKQRLDGAALRACDALGSIGAYRSVKSILQYTECSPAKSKL